MDTIDAHLIRRTNPSRPSENQAPPKHHSNAGKIAAGIIVVILLIVIAFLGWYGYRYWRARKLGLPPPSLNPFASQAGVSTRNYPARGGVVGWITGKFKQMQNKRTAGGAYESGRSEGARGFGRVDQDEGAWDPRMDRDEEGGYYGGSRLSYEEQELGLAGHHARGDSDASYIAGRGYGEEDTGYHAPRGFEEGAPRGHTRAISEYDVGDHGARGNPFADSAELSDMGGRGNRPTVDTTVQGGTQGQAHAKKGSKGDSPTSERRSVFHEEV